MLNIKQMFEKILDTANLDSEAIEASVGRLIEGLTEEGSVVMIETLTNQSSTRVRLEIIYPTQGVVEDPEASDDIVVSGSELTVETAYFQYECDLVTGRLTLTYTQSEEGDSLRLDDEMLGSILPASAAAAIAAELPESLLKPLRSHN